MASSRILIALLLCLTPISATSPPFSLQVLSTNNSFPGSGTPSNNATNFTAPRPPAGFSTQLKVNKSVHLKPLEVYICAIELISILAKIPWTSTIPMVLELSDSKSTTKLVLHPFPPFGGSRLQVRYAVQGLYEVGKEIAQKSIFCGIEATFYIREQEVGWLEFQPIGSPVLGSLDVIHVPQLKPGYANATAMMVTADSGKIFDPDEMDFALTFTWDLVRIKAQDIFTTFLDAFAIVAEYDNTDPDMYIPAASSASGDTVLSTWTAGEPGDAQMTGARLKRALIMIWELLIIKPQGQKSRFEGLVFGMEYKGKSIGAGRMLRFDGNGEDVGGSAVER